VLNKLKKRFKGSLVLLFKDLVAFVFIIVIYKGFNINTKLRLKPVTENALI
jgi:hypothetical protein